MLKSSIIQKIFTECCIFSLLNFPTFSLPYKSGKMQTYNAFKCFPVNQFFEKWVSFRERSIKLLLESVTCITETFMPCRKYHLDNCNRDSHLPKYKQNCHPHIWWKNCHLHKCCRNFLLSNCNRNSHMHDWNRNLHKHNCNRKYHLHSCKRASKLA